MVTTLIVGVLAGLGSGLLGSIAGPMLSHGLDERRRKQVRLENRNQELRRMIEALMRLARSDVSATIEIQMIDETTPVAEVPARLQIAQQRQHGYIQRIDFQNPDYTWRPMRIKDEKLQAAATGLNDARTQLLLAYVSRYNGLPITLVPQWKMDVDPKAALVEEFLLKVDARMDELGW